MVRTSGLIFLLESNCDSTTEETKLNKTIR